MIKVSILIPCYNAEKWIAQCIESALNQTYANKEVIVVDDGSTDGSLDIIKNFGDKIRWETSPNRGGNAARNRLLELSSGEWLQYLDADDYLLPNKIEEQIKVLQKKPNADVICSPAIAEYHDNGKVWNEASPQLYPRDPWILLARWRLPQTGGSLWRKQAIIDVGGWKIDQLCCQEHELYLRLLISEKYFVCSDKSGAVYRLWGNSTVSRKNKDEPFYRRLDIKNKIEAHLLSTGKMNPSRQNAINQARFECARIIYSFNKRLACELITKNYQQDPCFFPESLVAPKPYRFVYRWFGFVSAEKLAEFKRNFLTKTKSLLPQLRFMYEKQANDLE